LRHNDRPELGPPRLAHLTAAEYVDHKYVTPQQFANYFKFTIVRNPWDRMVSFYKYLGYHRCTTFKRFLTGYFTHRLWKDQYWFVQPQSEYIYTLDNECLVDYVGRFEVLSEAMDYVGKQVGLGDVSVPKINKSAKKSRLFDDGLDGLFQRKLVEIIKGKIKMRDDYRSYYDDESMLRVAELYKRDIDLFGYEFDPRGRIQTGEASLSG
jgi:hypothetical protein